ncbi:MAG: methyltransferase domain-containing protein, partial [Planctomycetota bacterium]
SLEPAAHKAALAGLRRLNAVSGTTGALVRALRPVLAGVPAEQMPRGLDVACGGGDGAIALTKWLDRALGREVRVDGCDCSPVAVETAVAGARAAEANCRFFEADALAGPLPGADETPQPRYDAAVSSLFLHHLTDEDAPAVLRNMAAAANAIVISDLRRTRLGLAMAHVACRALSRSPVVHADGPQSVRAAFTLDEFGRIADAAGLTGWTIDRIWPQRFLFTWIREKEKEEETA